MNKMNQDFLQICTCATCPMHNPLPKNITITCTSLDCPERKSICCKANSEAFIADEGTGYFICSNCKKEFIGGQCKANENFEKS